MAGALSMRDAELQSRRAAADEAMAVLDARKAEAERAAQAGASKEKIASLEQGVQSAYEQARRLAEFYNSGVAQDPLTQYQSIMSQAADVQAPELSAYEWWKQNPSLLEAVPLTDEQRTANAREAFILKRVHEAANSLPPSDPLNWSNYRGPEAGHMADLEVRAAEMYGIPGTAFQGYPERRRQLESPYDYRPWNKDDYGQNLPPGQQLLEAFRIPGALYGGIGRFKDNFIAGGRAASEGRAYEAIKDFAYAAPNLLSPSFHRGGEGMADDWRPAAGRPLANAIEYANLAGELLAGGNLFRRRAPAIPAAGDLARVEQLRRELGRRYHPDVGGSVEAMKAINRAADAGDTDTLMRFMAPAR